MSVGESEHAEVEISAKARRILLVARLLAIFGAVLVVIATVSPFLQKDSNIHFGVFWECTWFLQGCKPPSYITRREQLVEYVLAGVIHVSLIVGLICLIKVKTRSDRVPRICAAIFLFLAGLSTSAIMLLVLLINGSKWDISHGWYLALVGVVSLLVSVVVILVSVVVMSRLSKEERSIHPKTNQG